MFLGWSCPLGSVPFCVLFPPRSRSRVLPAAPPRPWPRRQSAPLTPQDSRSPTPGPDVGAYSSDPGLAQPPVQAPAEPAASGAPTLLSCPSGPPCSAVLCTPPCAWAALASAPAVVSWTCKPAWAGHTLLEPKAEAADVWIKAVMGPLTLELHFCGGPGFYPWLRSAIPHSSPFRMSPSSQHQSSPQVCPQPGFPARAFTSRCTFGWGHRAVARTTSLCSACLKLPRPPVSH